MVLRDASASKKGKGQPFYVVVKNSSSHKEHVNQFEVDILQEERLQ